ncbi:sodium:solute symporter family transporter, partial [Pseudomonas aeruginosa]
LKGASFIGVISLMAWGLGYFGRMILCLGGGVAVGFFGIAYLQAHPEQAGAVSENPERVFIERARILFNPWIAGVLLSAILDAVISTLRCPRLDCSSALTAYFYTG